MVQHPLLNFSHRYIVTRASLMRAARICSTANFHKAIRELQMLGYINYYPSFHPGKHSQVQWKMDEFVG
jgi:hypothetical protein